jgi:dihydrofolate reductase
MRKIVLYIATSLDGFIARKDNDIKWLVEFPAPEENPDYGYAEFLATIDTTLIGNTTYKEVQGFDGPWPYAEKVTYVFTRSGEGEDQPNIRFVHTDIPAFVNSLKEQEGKDIWLLGGGKLNTVFLQHDWIDEMIIHVMPVVLGEGVSLFEGGSFNSRFRLDSAKTYSNGVLGLHYGRLQPGK